MQDKKAREILEPMMKLDMVGGQEEDSDVAASAISSEMMEAMMKYMPLRGVLSFSSGKVSLEQLQGLLDQLNA